MSKAKTNTRTYSCVECGLYKNCASKRMKPYGNFGKEIMVLAEAPGLEEDKTGLPFQGKAGRLLQRMLGRVGIDLFEDCVSLNAVNCRPTYPGGNNRTPTNKEIDHCRRLVLMAIEDYSPKLIILLGNSAVYSLIGYRWKKDLGGINKWRGWTIPDQDFQTWIYPTFHPSFIERSETGVEQVVWEQDLREAVSLLEVPFPVYKEPRIDIIEDLHMLDNITNSEVAFDFETTGIKPHAAGHRILCCGVAPSEDHAYVFMMPETRQERQPLVNLLKDEKIGKIAHNMKFEQAWSNVRLRADVKNWLWDTMIMSHVLDNRTGITSLAFQVYVNFGVIDYKDETQKYMKMQEEKNTNSFNNLTELIHTEEGKKKLLIRCGLDAVNEYRLYKIQNVMTLPF